MITAFHIDIAVIRTPDDGSEMMAPDAAYSTDSVNDFAEYMASAMQYFRSMLRFENAVVRVSFLIRTYEYHKVIDLTIDPDGSINIEEN